MAMDTSPKADVVVDMAVDESPGENGGSRRPGNLWTVEAREDMFRRREAGETWETICQDYPKRSRHAMQQQYSMMKKQRALAAGTWTSNRRGRKRKNLSPERWAPANRNGALEGHDDDLTEADDLSDGEAEVSGEADAKDSLPRLPSLVEDPNIAGRPNGLSRSITDPAPRSARPKLTSNGTRLNIGPAQDAAPPRSSPSMKVQGALGEVSPVGAAGQGKRRKVSPDRPPDSRIPLATPSADAMSPNFSLPSVVFDHAEFLAFLQKGIDRAQLANSGYDAEKAALRQSFEASVARANRRAHDAQERLRWAQYESGEKIKARDREFNDKLKAKARDLAEEKDAMRKDFEREKKHVEEIQVKNIEALRRQNELLQRDLDHQRKQMEMQAHEYEQELSKLRNGRQQTRSATKIQDIVNGLPMVPEDKGIKHSPRDQAAASPSPGKDQVPTWKTLRQSQLDTFQRLAAETDTLASLFRRLNRDVESMPMKGIMVDLKRLDEQSTLVLQDKEKAAQALKAFHSEAETVFSKLTLDEPVEDEKMDAAPASNGD